MSAGKLVAAWRAKISTDGDVITQERMAELCGMTRSHVADIESGRSSPTVRTLMKIITAIEQRDGSLGQGEDRKLARFFLGPGATIARDVILPGGGHTQ
jgi:transcriptional regulator with XRE-family HTH domain